MNDRHRGQVAIELTQRRIAGRPGSRDDEVDAGGFELVGGLRQAGFDHRRRSEIGDVEDRAGPVVVGYRFAQHFVGHPRHHAHVRVGFPCQQRDFEIHRVVVAGADDGQRVGDVVERELASDAGLGLLGVGQPDNDQAGVFQLVGDRRGQRIVTADNDVAMHAAHYVIRSWRPLALTLTSARP